MVVMGFFCLVFFTDKKYRRQSILYNVHTLYTVAVSKIES